MLQWRLISAAVIIPLVLGLAALDYWINFGLPGVWLLPLAVAVAAMAAREVLGLLSSKGRRPSAPAAMAGTLAVVLAAAAPLATHYFADRAGMVYDNAPREVFLLPVIFLAVTTIVAFAAEMLRTSKVENAAVNTALTIFPVVYIGVLFSFVVMIRLMGSSEWGMTALLATLIVVKSSDAAQYFTGRLFGRHKLAPAVSPGKTIEGAVGGLACACLVSIVFFEFAAPLTAGAGFQRPDWWRCAAFGAIVACAGMVGDLAESLLKRDAGKKDSSRWLPGLGGVLDVIDSVLTAAPAAYLCFSLELISP